MRKPFERRSYVLAGLLLLLGMTLLLAGCGEFSWEQLESPGDPTGEYLPEDSFSGMITDYHFDEDGTLQSLSIHFNGFEDSEEYHPVYDYDLEIRVTEDTKITANYPGLEPERFLSGDFGKVYIEGTGEREKDAEGIVYRADLIHLYDVLTGETAEMDDGTKLRIWTVYRGREYETPEGKKILRVDDTDPPEFVTWPAAGLDQNAQEQIAKWYESQGTLYDESAELKKVWEEYVRQGKPGSFIEGYLGQTPMVKAYNDQYLFYETELSMPWTKGRSKQVELGAVFEKATGQKVDTLSLFSAAPEEVGPTLIRMAGVKDPTLVKELKEAFRPEYILFRDPGFGLVYPPETLPSHPDSYAIWFKYDENIRSILKPEAVPNQR